MTIYNRQPDGTYVEMIDDAVISSNSEITRTNKIWFDLNSERPRIYNPNKSKWGFLKYRIGYADFDNNLGGVWTSYINIPISTAPEESIQYKIEIAGDNINVYSNDGTTVLATGTGGLDFWEKVQNDGKDIRVFDETKSQNYFWIEEFDITNQKCIIWTRINAGQTQLNIAYGNSDCLSSNYHNGDMTFEFFDDFGDGTLSKWTTDGWKVATSEGNPAPCATASDTWKYMYANTQLQKYIISCDYNTANLMNIFFACDASGYGHVFRIDSRSENHPGFAQKNGWGNRVSSLTPIAPSVPENTWGHCEIVVDGTSAKADIGNGVNYSTTISPQGNYFGVEVDGLTGAQYVDNFIIRKYIADLTFGTPTINTF